MQSYCKKLNLQTNFMIFFVFTRFYGILPDYHLKNFVSNLYKQDSGWHRQGLDAFSHDSALTIVDSGRAGGAGDVNSAASDGDSDVVFICERGCAADVRFVVGVVDGSYFRRTE